MFYPPDTDLTSSESVSDQSQRMDDLTNSTGEVETTVSGLGTISEIHPFETVLDNQQLAELHAQKAAAYQAGISRYPILKRNQDGSAFTRGITLTKSAGE